MGGAALVVEDDPRMADRVVGLLRQEGYSAATETDGARGLKRAAAEPFDIIVLDRMLPTLEGLDILRKLRELDIRAPVLMLSALGRTGDKVEGLETGADDYLAKPFADEEFVARVRSLARRAHAGPHPEVLLVGDIEIRVKARTVHRAGKHIPTSRKEFELLRCLAEHAGHFLPRAFLLERVWNLRFDPQTNVVDVHVSRLRRKLDEGFDREALVSARGEGYKLDPGP
jgi:two-component system OmpR family response regulator